MTDDNPEEGEQYGYTDEWGLIHRTPEEDLIYSIFHPRTEEERFREGAVTNPNPEVRRRCLRNLESIIAPNRGKSYKPKIPRWLRSAVFKRDGFRCQWCDSQDLLEADHIIPETLGGETILENLWTLCSHCNKLKGPRIISSVVDNHRRGERLWWVWVDA